MSDLKSSVTRKGKRVTQIITFRDGYKKTIEGIDTETIKQSEFTHMETDDGRLVLINPKNVLLVEIFEE